MEASLGKDRGAPRGWRASGTADQEVDREGRRGWEVTAVDRMVEGAEEEAAEAVGGKAPTEEVLGRVEEPEEEVEEEEDQVEEGAVWHRSDRRWHPWTPPLTLVLPHSPDPGHLLVAPLSPCPGCPALVAWRESRAGPTD